MEDLYKSGASVVRALHLVWLAFTPPNRQGQGDRCIELQHSLSRTPGEVLEGCPRGEPGALGCDIHIERQQLIPDLTLFLGRAPPVQPSAQVEKVV
jgi:hypothetical protein